MRFTLHKAATKRNNHPTETTISDPTLPFSARHERAGGSSLDMERFPLTLDAHGRLMLCPPGAQPQPVTPVRAFPLSAADESISLVGRDGVELGWIQRLSDITPASRALIETALAERACTPVILHIRRISSRVTPSDWEIDTDRGRTQLTLKAEEDIRRLPHGALLIADAHGLSFLVPRINALDKSSRRLLDHFL